LASTIAQPTGVVENNPGDVTTTIIKCDGNGLKVFEWLIFSYHLIILGWGSRLAWRVRNILLFQFNESKHMMFAVYNFSIASILLLPITYVAITDETSVLILSALLKTWAFLGSLLFLFIPKFYAIYQNIELPQLVELQKSQKSSRRDSKSESGWEHVSPEDVKNYAVGQSELIKTLKSKLREYEHILVDTYEWTGALWEDVKIPKPRGLRPSVPPDTANSGMHGTGVSGVSGVGEPQSSKFSNISDVDDNASHPSQSHNSKPPERPATPNRTVGIHVRNAPSLSSKPKNTTVGVVI